MAGVADQITPEVIQVGHDIILTKQLFIAAFTFYIFDHLLTLKHEVRYFWGQRPTLPSVLFFLTRYYTHFAFAMSAFLYLSPRASEPKFCASIMLFEPLGVALPITLLSSSILTARVYAIYNRSKMILLFLLIFLVALVVASVWVYGILSHIPLPLPPIPADAYQLCINEPTPSPSQKNFTLTWILMQCAFDFTVLMLTLGKTAYYEFRSGGFRQRSNLSKIIIRDGVLYFLCIFTSNFIWAMMVLTADPGIKYILAEPNLAICATAASRISINLRATGNQSSLSKFRSTADLHDIARSYRDEPTKAAIVTSSTPWEGYEMKVVSHEEPNI